MAGPFGGAEDLSAFIDGDEFAETVSFSTSSGSVDVVGIWDEPFDDPTGIASTLPTLMCRQADCSSVAEGATATRDDASAYVVRQLEPHGAGMVLVRLEEAP